ncbi:MAG: insulinase family protein [Acidobacteria bacterium]|nr:insulinase family protein [Acidobacteriota bacterium]
MTLSPALLLSLFAAAAPALAQTAVPLPAPLSNASPAGPPGSSAAACPRIDVPYTQFQLANGLNVILHEDHTVPLVAVDLWFRVGSAREKPGRTGLAHLFEHILFEGSSHVKPGEFDKLLEGVGGDNNGSTNNDRTNYYEVLPANALDLALFLESDRMGFLLDVLSPARVDQQRDVVKNERRERIENQPYGMASIRIEEEIFPAGHPYHSPVIGSMEDLTAATHDDVAAFFRSFYSPANASVVVSGDFQTEDARRKIETWFSDVAAGPRPPVLAAAPAVLAAEKRVTLEDRVQLPRLYMAWITPAQFHPGDEALDLLSSVLASGKNSRLYKRLVYDLQIAQDVSAVQDSRALASMFLIAVTAREGHTLTEIERVVQEELDRVKREPPSARELERALNQYEAGFYRALERNRDKADLMNAYDMEAGRPDYFNEDLARHRALDGRDVQSIARRQLPNDARVVLSVVPTGKTALAASRPKGGSR